MTIDRVAWSDLTRDKGLPALMMAVFAGEPKREITVQMRYCDLVLIKQLVDRMVEDSERLCPPRADGKSHLALKNLIDLLGVEVPNDGE